MLHGYNYRELHTVAPGFVCLVIAHGLIRLRGTHVGLGGGCENALSGTKKEVKRVARGMNPITCKPRTYDPLPRAVFFSLSLGLCLPFSTLPLPDTAAFLSVAFLPRSASRPTTQAAQGRVHTASFSGFSPAPFFFSTFPLSLSLSSFLFVPFLASFLHSFRPSRFSCILTRLHARGFAVRPDYPSLLPPAFLSSTLTTLASLPLLYTARHNSSRTLVPFSPSSVAYSPSFSRARENIAPSFSNRVCPSLADTVSL